MRNAIPVLAALPAPALAGTINGAVFFSSIPTLDEVGLGVLIALVAGVAGWAVRRGSRK
jgi:hypothetical protein